MLVISQMPRTYCPNSKSRPVQWTIQTDEHIDTPGTFASFTVTFNTTGGANGETIEIAGQTMTVDNSQPFGYKTFQATGTSREVAENFLNAMRTDPTFELYLTFLSGSGGTWSANAIKYEATTEENWTFDDAGTTMDVDITDANGAPPVLKNVRIWYRLYDINQPVSTQRYADIIFDSTFPFFSEVPIDAESLLRGLVSTTPPSYAWFGPVLDTNYSKRFHLRYGLIEFDDNCDRIYGQSGFTSEIILTNSVWQLHETREFLDHCPATVSEGTVQFLTDRPDSMVICFETYEWVHIWLERLGTDTGIFRIRFRFYAGPEEDDFISQYEQLVKDGFGAYIIGIGPADNALSSAIPIGTTRYTIQVYKQREDGIGGFEDVPYSITLERHLVACDCKAAEVYFLEDNGSWRTVIFEKVTERTIEQRESAWEQPLDKFDTDADTRLFDEGSRYSEADLADQTFVLLTEKISERKRPMYEQLVRSPECYIKTMTAQGKLIVRRIIFNRQTFITSRRGEAIRLQLRFRFNTRLKIH